MINQLEIPMYIEQAVPEMPLKLLISSKNSAYELLQNLSAFTCSNIKNQNYKVVKRTFDIADKLYTKGNSVVKNAVENVYVFSFTRMFQTFPGNKQQILSMLPVSLYTLYISQVCHNGC